jgi:biopolymer transport protein ExbB/TolQ
VNSYESGTRLYSDLEIELLINELTEAALEAIEQAASEAARAAILASLERETYALREAQRWRMEAELRQQAIALAKQVGRRNTLLAAVIGILGGLALGAGGTIYMGR